MLVFYCVASCIKGKRLQCFNEILIFLKISKIHYECAIFSWRVRLPNVENCFPQYLYSAFPIPSCVTWCLLSACFEHRILLHVVHLFASLWIQLCFLSKTLFPISLPQSFSGHLQRPQFFSWKRCSLSRVNCLLHLQQTNCAPQSTFSL